jgi:hypothetical protein
MCEVQLLRGLYEWTSSEPLLRTIDTGILERPSASIDRLHFMRRLRLLIGTPNALSSGKIKRGFGCLFGCWIGAVPTLIDVRNRVASELVACVDRY